MSYFEAVKPTYIENWPAALQGLSIEQIAVPMTLEEASALGSNIMEYFEAFGAPEIRDIRGLTARVDAAVKQFRDGAFVRLGSRSPKDSWRGHKEGFRCADGRKAIGLLTDCSERISDDLQLAITHHYAPHIWVRRWQDIAPWAEFRCVMRDRKLTGISQYNYRSSYAEIAQNHDALKNAIHGFFDLRFEPVCHLDNVVFDVFVTREKYRCGSARSFWKVTLLEINPYCELTDPCLFDWAKGDDFDGSFRYLQYSPRLEQNEPAQVEI